MRGLFISKLGKLYLKTTLQNWKRIQFYERTYFSQLRNSVSYFVLFQLSPKIFLKTIWSNIWRRLHFLAGKRVFLCISQDYFGMHTCTVPNFKACNRRFFPDVIYWKWTLVHYKSYQYKSYQYKVSNITCSQKNPTFQCEKGKQTNDFNVNTIPPTFLKWVKIFLLLKIWISR